MKRKEKTMTNTIDRMKFDNEMKVLAEGIYNGNKKLVPYSQTNES